MASDPHASAVDAEAVPRIAVLPPDVAERIAAGEVIERPASVVKELIENALDAGASWIAVEVAGGGLTLIRVADNGCGVAAEDVELAFQRHATSKLRMASDLLEIRTLGFRGEALASMAAVAEVSLHSATEGGHGVQVTVRAGRVLERMRRPRARGTTVTVRRLFAALPARRQFLHSPAAEVAQIVQTVRRFAAGYAAVRFDCAVDSRTVLASSGSGRLEDALGELFGGGEAFLPVGSGTAGIARVWGCTTAPSVSRATRRDVLLYANGRPTRNRALEEAVEAAYRPFFPRGRHPIAVLHVEVPPGAADPNVHPSKLEVRLRWEGEIADGLGALVGASYRRHPTLPLLSPDAALGPVQLRLRSPRRRVAEERAGGYGAGEDAVGVTPQLLVEGRLLGQMHDSLLLVELPSGLLLVDQHRAHERVIFEALQRARISDSGNPSQALLAPLVLETGVEHAEQLESRLAALARLGFGCERFGERQFVVRTLPAIADSPAWADFALDLLRAAAAGEEHSWEQELLVGAACNAAVRRGHPLRPDQARNLLERLTLAGSVHLCPHGEPLLLAAGRAWLARQLGWR